MGVDHCYKHDAFTPSGATTIKAAAISRSRVVIGFAGSVFMFGDGAMGFKSI